MTRLLSFILLLLIGSSCKVQYASFQESTGPRYNSGLKKKWHPSEIHKLKLKPVQLPSAEVDKAPKVISFDKKVIPILISPEAKERKVYHFGPYIDGIDLSGESFSAESGDKHQSLVKKKKGKKFRQVSSNLFLGILFLVVAGVLGYLNLLSLAILFALASIIFIILAVKQLWKRRGKNKKKENRKKFFKDLFS